MLTFLLIVYCLFMYICGWEQFRPDGGSGIVKVAFIFSPITIPLMFLIMWLIYR